MSDDVQLTTFVRELDELILKWTNEYTISEIAGVLLSRVTLSFINDPVAGKQLLQYVWSTLDELDQSNPNQYL